MKKSNRGFMSGVRSGRAARKDAQSLPPELPPSVPAVSVARSNMLATVSEPLELPPPHVSRVSINNKPSVSALPPAEPVMRPVMRPRLVFAVDATASRSNAWDAAKKLTDVLLQTLPGQLDVALAVHGGHELHTFTALS